VISSSWVPASPSVATTIEARPSVTMLRMMSSMRSGAAAELRNTMSASLAMDQAQPSEPFQACTSVEVEMPSTRTAPGRIEEA
jgi:hypothetical protein